MATVSYTTTWDVIGMRGQSSLVFICLLEIEFS